MVELKLAAKLAGDRGGRLQALLRELAGRHHLAVAVEEVGRQPVAGRLKARFGECLAGRDPVLVALGLDPGEAMDQRREGTRAPEVELGVGSADLDRAERRMDPDVPPDVGVVLEAARGADLAR